MFDLLKTRIRKLVRAVVASGAATAFLFSGLMLCCQVGVVHAHQLRSKISSCCENSRAQHFKEPNAKTCGCCKISRESPDQVNNSFEIAKPSGHLFHKGFLAVEHLVQFVHHHSLVSLACQGPPRANLSVPIYLQFSNLRL